MVDRKRRHQETNFTGVVNQPPRFRPPGTVRHGPLAAEGQPELSLLDAWEGFEAGVRQVLLEHIRGARIQNRSLDELKKELENSKRILNEVYSYADRINEVKANRTRNKVSRQNPLARQKRYIQAHFDTIANDPQSEVKKDQGPQEPPQKKTATATKQTREYRAVTTTFNSVLRTEGITDDMEQHFRQRFTAATVDVSNHVIDHGVHVLRYITMFQTHTFQLNNNQIVFDVPPPNAPRLTLADMLPESYIDNEEPPRLLPPHLNPNVVNNEQFQQLATSFMNEPYLERISTTYLGSGMTDDMLARYPLHAAIIVHLPRPQNVPPITFNSLKAIARSTYNTNFENLWNLKRRFTKVFNKVIQTLLKVHLAPDREAAYQEYLQSKRQQQQQHETAQEQDTQTEGFTFAGKTRNQRKRIFANEKKNHASYNDKARKQGGHWVGKARRSSDRLITMSFARQQEKRQPGRDTAMASAADQLGELDLEDMAETNPVVSSQLDELQDSQTAASGDITAREIRELAATIRTTIFTHHGQATPVTEQQLQQVDKTIHGAKSAVCLRIINQLMPYIPSRQTWFSKLHQIPLILLANDIFRATGYARFAVKLANLPSVSSLIALEINADSIYSTFCAQQDDQHPLDFFNYDTEIITNSLMARGNEDAVFHSIFDREKIDDIMRHYQLEFGHRMVLLPGLKTVRILGLKLKTLSPNAATLIPPESTAVPPNRKRAKEDKKEEMTDSQKEELEDSIDAQKALVAALAAQLKTTTKEQGEFIQAHYQDIKDHKNDFPTNMEQQTTADAPSTAQTDPKAYLFPRSLQKLRSDYYQRIDNLKETRDNFHRTIVRIKQELAEARYQLHVLRSTKSKGPPSEAEPPSRFITQITNSNFKCYEKAENVQLHESLHHSDDMSFAGTDNGVVTMTETVRFNINRFKFHLRLANKFQVLDGHDDNDDHSKDSKHKDIDDDGASPMNIDDDNDPSKDTKEAEAKKKEIDDDDFIAKEIKADPSLLHVPKPHKVHAKSIDFLTGAKRQRSKLYKAKHTPNGQLVQEAEAILSGNSLHNATNMDQLNERYATSLQQRDTIRNFYHTPAMVNNRHRYEFTKRKNMDRICAEERRYVKHGDEQPQKGANYPNIIFVGDRGTGIGSRIKGHLRYGGFWKAKTHSLYTSVCITNEHNTSQTCGYCFHKTTHPLIVNNGKLKSINGTSICVNPECVLVQYGRSHQARDSLSAFLIGLSGLCNVISGTTFPSLNPKRSIGYFNTDFTTFAGLFITKKQA